jgi:aldose 1-epimerase
MKFNKLLGIVGAASIILGVIGGCAPKQKKSTNENMDIKKEIVGQVDGKDVYQFTLTNAGGMSAKVLSYGAIVTHLYAPDRDGKMENVVLGFDDPAQYWTEPYINDAPYFGSVVGRYGNRIAQGKFTLNGKEYLLATNNGPNHLHGGLKGFDKVVWDAEPVMTEEGQGVKLTYNSVDGEEGYPGNLTISITYTLTKDNCLKCDYSGTIDQPCPVNVTHHGYFNLTGGAKTNVLGHEMQIMADRYTVVDETLIPTGELRPVAGTPMDFTEPHTIGERIDQVEGGYDHNYVLSDDVTELRPVATVKEPVSGRSLEVLTTEPGVQFYSGNFLLGNLTGSGGVVYNKHWGFCLETQHYPDSPNQPTFPSTILEPGEKYSHTTVYRFGN